MTSGEQHYQADVNGGSIRRLSSFDFWADVNAVSHDGRFVALSRPEARLVIVSTADGRILRETRFGSPHADLHRDEHDPVAVSFFP
jgi:hypothetical protein